MRFTSYFHTIWIGSHEFYFTADYNSQSENVAVNPEWREVHGKYPFPVKHAWCCRKPVFIQQPAVRIQHTVGLWCSMPILNIVSECRVYLKPSVCLSKPDVELQVEYFGPALRHVCGRIFGSKKTLLKPQLQRLLQQTGSSCSCIITETEYIVVSSFQQRILVAVV